MNPVVNLDIIANQFSGRIQKLYSEVVLDNLKIERYCILSIALLNNFLRAYLLSIRTKAVDSNGMPVSFLAQPYLTTQNDFIDEIIRIGNPRRWNSCSANPNRAANWQQKDEPAYHTPRVFLSVVGGLNCSNINNIRAAMTESWKIDVLRETRNYFAHRARSTEVKAMTSVKNRYAVDARAAKILLLKDPTLNMSALEDINDHIINFAAGIC